MAILLALSANAPARSLGVRYVIRVPEVRPSSNVHATGLVILRLFA